MYFLQCDIVCCDQCWSVLVVWVIGHFLKEVSVQSAVRAVLYIRLLRVRTLKNDNSTGVVQRKEIPSPVLHNNGSDKEQ